VSGYLYDQTWSMRRAPWSAAARRHAWPRSTCPAPAGPSSTRPNALAGGRNLIRVAVARDPAQAVPLTGTYVGGAGDFIEMTVEVVVSAG